MKEYALDEASAPHSEHTEHHGLHANTLNTFELLAQSVAGIAPCAAMATGPALVALNAGDSVMYSYIASMVVMLLIGWLVLQYAKRQGPEGTLLSYIKSALGPVAAFVGAISLAFGYLMIAVVCVAGFIVYLAPLLAFVGVDPENTTYQLVVTVIIMVLAAMVMIVGVHLSTRAAMVLEVLSVIAILVVLLAVLVKHGISSVPIAPKDFGLSGVTGGMVLAILSFVGFESAANLGVEAKDPAHSVPRAVIGSAIIVGLLFSFSAMAQLSGFGSGAAVSESAAPLNDLANAGGVGWMGYLVDVGAVLSFFACITGSLNAGSRLMFEIARDGFLPTSFGNAHRVRMTPHRSIIMLSTVCAGVSIVMMLGTSSILDVLGVAGTIGTFGYMLAYIMMAFGIIWYLRRRGASVVLPAIIGIIAGGALLYVMYKNIEAATEAPYSYLHWVFLGVVVLALVWYLIGRSVNRQAGQHAEPMGEESVEAF